MQTSTVQSPPRHVWSMDDNSDLTNWLQKQWPSMPSSHIHNHTNKTHMRRSLRSNVGVFFKHLAIHHTTRNHSPIRLSPLSKVFLVSALSLSVGASLGPEAAMGCAGGCIGAVWSDMRGRPAEERRENVRGSFSFAIIHLLYFIS